MNGFSPRKSAALLAVLVLGSAHAETTATNHVPSAVTNAPTTAPSAPRKLDESAFRIVSERNIFNANRSGGTVRSTTTRRAPRVDSFALVGTMAYEKGAFAFFEGSSSEFTKVLKANGVIAGHKIVDILANGVKLEIDGQVVDLAIGSGLRREDQGLWAISDAVSTSNGGSSSRRSRSERSEDSGSDHSSSSSTSTSSSAAPSGDQSEILKRLMERRAKESQ